MKSVFIFFAIGLLACARMRENRSVLYSEGLGISLSFDGDSLLIINEKPKPFYHDIDTSTGGVYSSPANGYNLLRMRDNYVGAQSNLSPDSVDKIIGEIYGFRVPTEIGNGGFIIATPGVPYAMSAKDSMLFANAQKFSVHVNIAFPKMTLQQAAELEARLRKLLPEAQEINLDLGQDVEVPVDEFYHVPEDIEISPNEMKNFYLPPTAPPKGLKPGKVLKIDSMDAPVWQ